MVRRHAVVAGAGIGGLTAAVALHRQGWEVTVCERAPALPATGAGIGLAPNALRALDAIGVDAAYAAGRSVPATMGVRSPDGRWLTRSATADMAARYGVAPIAVPRPAFTAALAAALPPECLRYGTTVTGVDDAAGRAVVRTGDGSGLPADLVVAADGIHSPLRRAFFPAHPGLRYVGETAWRTMVDAAGAGTPAMSETWGPGRRFGVTPLSDGRYYLYATAVVPAGTRPSDPVSVLRRLFGTWHDPIPALLDRVGRLDPAELLCNDLYDLAAPLPRLHHGRIAWLGDAAHAMTPNLGQGGCQAIEDAAVLAHLLTDTPAHRIPTALTAYTTARHTRTDSIRRQARRTGRLGVLRDPLAVAARNLAVRVTPDRLALRGMDGLFNGFRLPARELPHDRGAGTA
ncbi:FAD-dependent monooxygenase [Streptomyces sp. NPDC091027]|uniref:FAD-dependent monooxygenase n=1 Tax=Streptomyces sp. NPDC091027 TaxID=3365971 RepID=UPI00380972D0